MPSPRVFLDEVGETGLKYLRARVTDQDGTVLTTNDVLTNIPIKVFNLSAADPDTAIYSANLVVASTIKNTLQTWTRDTTGFNFETTLGTNNLTLTGGNTYQIEAIPQHTSDGGIPIVWQWRVRTLLST